MQNSKNTASKEVADTAAASKKLGILGGLGPMSSVYFYELLTLHTDARRDQDHLDLILSSGATTPDRTAFILGQSSDSPLPRMIADAKALIAAGADLIAIPCNTAHYFYDALADAVPVPVINILRETVNTLARRGIRKIGVLATAGTVESGAYHHVCTQAGVECLVPDAEGQAILNRIIYEEIKQGRPVDMDAFFAVSAALLDAGCERLVLGCTELSLLKRDEGLSVPYFDSLDALAYRSILACGKRPVGFAADFTEEEE